MTRRTRLQSFAQCPEARYIGRVIFLKFLQTTTTETTPETTNDSVEIVVQTEAPSNETSSTLAEIPFKGKIFLKNFFL